MSDHMEQDAERLIQTLESCAVDPMSNGYAEVSKRLLVAAACSLRTLLAHIQRGVVPKGERAAFESWVENEAGAGAARRWLNTEAYENGRVQDYRTGWIACLEWLAAAPAPDHFRDAAEMVSDDPDPLHLSRILHELAGSASLCWEPRPSGVFDSQLAIQFVEQALSEIRSRMMLAPVEVPMPECYVTSGGRDLFSEEQMLTYGAACRAAGEAAGYAQGLAEAGRDADPLVQNGEVLVTVTGLTGSGKSAIAGEIEIMCRALGLEVEWGEGAAEKHLTHADWTNALEMYRPRVRIVEANIPRTDAALRGEVK